MNTPRTWFAVALLACSAHTAFAQPLPTPPIPARPITLNDTTIVGSAFASDAQEAEPIEQPSPPPEIRGGEAIAQDLQRETTCGADCPCCNKHTGDCRKDSSCDDACRLVCETEEPWRLFGCCGCLKEHQLNVRGWLSGGVTGNFSAPASRFNGPVTFNDRDEAQFNQGYLILEKPLDTECYGWDLGGRVDMLYGSDYRFTISRGLDAEDDFTASWNNGRFYGVALPQAYAEVGADKLALKVGHFYTILGYEVVTAPDNYFYSHAYTMQYGEPFTHGALVTWTPNEQLTVMGGVTYGWDNFEDVYDDASILAGVTFAASDGNSKLALATHLGEEEETFGTVTPNDERWVYSMVYTRTLTDRLSWVVQHDNGRQTNALGQGQTAEWYGLNQYLFYKIDCCWTFGARLEWFRDDDGFRVAPAGDYPALGVSNNPASAGGFEGDFWALTAGFNYKPTANLTIRPELRYDWYDGRANALGNNPFDDGGRDDQTLAAFDVIYQY